MPDGAVHPAGLRHHQTVGDSDSALRAAWCALDSEPTSWRTKSAVADVIALYTGPIDPQREDDLHRLLIDPDLDPGPFAAAGWRHLAAHGRLPSADATGAPSVEADPFIRAMLTETIVTVAIAELRLTALRRWLLVTDRAADFPRATAAFIAQAARNAGAWPFDAEERAALERSGQRLRPAYLPPRPGLPDRAVVRPTASSIGSRVAAQYEGWPFPTWERVTRRPGTLQRMIDRLDPGTSRPLPARPDILIAGCGTGVEALTYAKLAPNAGITAIDLSAASLRYARPRCADVANIEFRQHDLYDIASLQRSFDVIVSSGVVHHLPDPEAGWSALVSVLKPGGVMNLQLYSAIGRLRVRAARQAIADLMDRPVDDDLIREARARLIAAPYNPLSNTPDFYSVAGAHDLIFHVHEDLFDIPRIRSAVEANGLELLRFVLPSRHHQTRYEAAQPGDPDNRDFAGWQAYEKRNPTAFSAMYNFWCRKPLA